MTDTTASDDEQTPLLSIGIVRGIRAHAMRFVIQDLVDLMQLVAREASRAASNGLRLNIIFGVPGADDVLGYEVDAGRFYSKRNLLVIGAAVPKALSPVESTSFIRSTLSAAVGVAEERMRKKRIAIDTTQVRTLAERIADALPEHPLDGPERFREDQLRPSAEGPVRAFVELNGAGRELRRVEIYADGKMDYAVKAIETGKTRLRNARAPGLIGDAISEDRFDRLWQQAIGQPQPRGEIRVVDYPVT